MFTINTNINSKKFLRFLPINDEHTFMYSSYQGRKKRWCQIINQNHEKLYLRFCGHNNGKYYFIQLVPKLSKDENVDCTVAFEFHTKHHSYNENDFYIISMGKMQAKKFENMYIQLVMKSSQNNNNTNTVLENNDLNLNHINIDDNINVNTMETEITKNTDHDKCNCNPNKTENNTSYCNSNKNDNVTKVVKRELNDTLIDNSNCKTDAI